VVVIGVSSLGSAHLTLGKPLIDAARQEQLMGVVVFVIGVFPPDDTVRLKEIGFDAIQYLTVVRQSAILAGIRSCK
jgi:methylmalonyl-CoA mutase cobalamin-binding domain/chain